MKLPGAVFPTLVVATAALAVGCGGSGGGGEPVATTNVAMAKSYRFDPRTIEVAVGETVTWTNDDNFTHTVQIDGQPDHEVGRGESVSIPFPERGTFHYVCTLHPHDMDGEVIVR